MKVIEAMPKTEAAVCGAFVELLGEMPYTAVRVKDIAARSGVGRTTFYTHFKDRDELLDQLENALVAGFEAHIHTVREQGTDAMREQIRSGAHPGFAGYFHYLRENADAFVALLRPQEGVRLYDKLLAMLLAKDLSQYVPGYKTREPNSQLSAYHHTIVSNYLNIFISWLLNGMALSDEAMGVIVTAYWEKYMYSVGEEIRKLIRGES